MGWKVVIADDEPVILDGLKSFVEKSGLGCEIAGLAENGREAMDLIERLHPDIVISDIQMPEATGLEMIRKWHGEADCPKFIFISGYQEFDYVHEAIRYEAVDFLLKPVSMPDIQHSLKKTIERLQEQDTMKAFQEDKQDVMQTFFNTIHNGSEYSEREYYHRFSQMGVVLENRLFQSVCFSVPEEMGEESARNELVKFVIYDRIAKWYTDTRLGFLTKKDRFGCHIIMIIEKEKGQDWAVRQVLSLKERIDEEYHVNLLVGVGDMVDEVSRLTYAFRSAQLARGMYYFEERPVIFASEIHHEYTASFEEYHMAVQKAVSGLILQEEDAEEKVKRVLDCIEDLHYGNRQAAVSKVSLFVEEVSEALQEYGAVNESVLQLREAVLEGIHAAVVFNEVRKGMGEYAKALGKALRETSKDCREIALVKEYMKRSYNQDITLKKLAEMVGMNPAYFSAFFKKNTGENYVTYLQNIRLQEAHRLLMKTDMLTYQISDAVGYNTVRRFTEAFRKKYGLNPMDYRKKYSALENEIEK